jgi:hypothetical protein
MSSRAAGLSVDLLRLGPAVASRFALQPGFLHSAQIP